jgi:hypothetical protein
MLKTTSENLLNTVMFVDALVGAGKTYRTIESIAESANDETFLIATPNTELSRETADKLVEMGISVKQIDSEDGTNCAHALKTALVEDAYKVMIANVGVVLKIEREYTGKRHLIIDEIPAIYNRIALEGMVVSKNQIKTFFTTSPSKENPDFLDVAITSEGVEFLGKWHGEKVFVLRSDDDDQTKPKLVKVLECAWDEHYRVVISAESYAKFMDGDGKRLNFFILLMPSILEGFRSVTILGANFTNSLLYLVHGSNINFAPHPTIKGRYSDHSHKAKQTKLYYFSKRDCSKTLFNEIGFQFFFDAAAKAIADRFPNTPHIFTMNNPKKEIVKGKWVTPEPYKWELEGTTGKRVSPDPRGQNGLKDYDMAIHMAALNYSKTDFQFFNDFLSISSDEAVRSMSFDMVYQFIGRTSVRTLESNAEIILVVFDRRTAKWLQSLIGCEEPEFIELGIEELHEAKQTKEELRALETGRQARRRANKAEEERLALDEATPQYEGFGSRVWSTGADKEPSYEKFYAFDDLVDLFERAAETPKKFKAEVAQFREGSYGNLNDPAIAGNLASSKLLVLDADDCHRSPEEVSTYLSSRGLTHLIYQSFSHKGYPYRFHIVIPMSRSVSEKNYRHIFKIVKADLEARFGGSDELGIDKNGGSINKWIAMPCKSKFDADIFIVNHAWKNILTKEYSFLDVREYLTRRLSKGEADVEVQAPSEAHSETLDADAIVNAVAETAVAGQRDDAFKQAGFALLNKNVPEHEAIRVLDAHKHRFGKAGDRGAANRLVKSLASIQSRHALL